MKKILVLSIAFVFIALIGCGGAAVNLGKTHEGPYFTISYPSDLNLEEKSDGGINLSGAYKINVDTETYEESVAGNVESIMKASDEMKSQVEENGGSLNVEPKEIGGHKGLWIEGTMKDGMVFAMLYPMDGKFAFALVEDPVTDKAHHETIKSILESFTLK